MLIVEQGHEIITNSIDDPMEVIELAGRTCYKSEDKIAEGTAEPFCRMLIKRGHEAMIEHGYTVLTIPQEMYGYIKEFEPQEISFFAMTDKPDFIISGNIRAFREFLKKHTEECVVLRSLHEFFLHQYPSLFDDIYFYPPFSNTSMQIRLVNLNRLSIWNAKEHIRETVKFITNRGVTHELARHRPPSFGQESTRYCNYGGKEIKMIKPVWWNDRVWNSDISWIMSEGSDQDRQDFVTMTEWKDTMERLEEAYNTLLAGGWRPEQAREVLPNSLKTEIVVTATLKEWHHIFSLRAAETTGRAHPQMKALMIPVLKDFQEKYPGIFGDLHPKE
jgi:thymidylate synthase (FAD)